MRSGLLAVILTAFAQAQEATVSMKIDLVSWGDAIKGLSLKTAESKGGLTAQSFRYSQPVSYSGPAILEIYRGGSGAEEPVPEPTADDLAHQLMPLPPVDEKVEAGDKKLEKTGLALELEKRRKKAPTLVSLAALPSGCSRATVLLAPADGETYTSYVIDDDPSKLPPGQLRIHNLSPLEILVRCNGKQQKELKTRESFISPAENQQIIYELAYKAGDEWKMQENNIIPIRENEQTQMMILKSKNSFFQSTDGSSGGFLQIVTLRRGPSR
jgi:hypothetical protein